MQIYSLAVLAGTALAQGSWSDPDQASEVNYRRFGLPRDGLVGDNVAGNGDSGRNDINLSTNWWTAPENLASRAAKAQCHADFVARQSADFDTHQVYIARTDSMETVDDSKAIVKCLSKKLARDNHHIVRDGSLGEECYNNAKFDRAYFDTHYDSELVNCLVEASRFSDVCPQELEEEPRIERLMTRILSSSRMTAFYWCYFDRMKSIFRDQLSFADDVTAFDLAGDSIGQCLIANGLRDNVYGDSIRVFSENETDDLKRLFKRNCRMSWQVSNPCEEGEYFDDLGNCVEQENA